MAKSEKALKKFRVGYSVKWNFNGIMEVEAENADEAEKQAQVRLDAQADDGEFVDVTNFHAEFDDVNVLDVEEVKDDEVEVVKGGPEHDEECRYARALASCSTAKFDGEAAAKVIADAVVWCKAHPVVLHGNGLVSFDYDNSFGPTVTVDDVLERMTMRDWRMACDRFCRNMLHRGGFDPENFDWPAPRPKVMKVPEEEGTDVISRVCVTFEVDEKTYDALLEAVNETADDRGEETCCECDVQIKYKVEKGKTVVTCPECGAINPLCNECSRPERGQSACDKCELFRKCEELNRLRAMPRKQEKGE